MDPINYLAMVPQEDFLRDIQGGFQLGAGIRESRQLEAARDLAMQQKKAVLQRQQDYQAGVQALFAAPKNQQAQLAAKLAVVFPEQYESVTKGFGLLTADQQKNELQDTWQIASALHADRPDLARAKLDERITAMKNSGEQTTALEALRSKIDQNPKAAYGELLHIASALPGGDKILSNLGDLGKEQRAQELQGAAVREAGAKADGEVADAAQKNLGIVAQTAGALAKPGVKPAQAVTMFKSLEARGVIPKGGAQEYIDGMPADPKALPDYLHQVQASGMKADDQMKYTTPDANSRLSADTQVKTTSMNNRTQLAVQDRIDARTEARADIEPTLAPATLKSMAQQYLAGDKTALQNLGRGAQGAANLVALRNAITEEGAARGMDGATIAAKIADFEGLKVGLRTSANISARVENAIAEAKELAPLAIEAGRQVSRSGFLPFGKAQVMFNTQTNDPAMKKFAAANVGFVTAYAGAMARGQKPTVHDKEHAEKVLSEATSQEAYEATMDQLMLEMEAASRAPQNVREHLRGEISGGKGGSHSTTPAAGGQVIDFGSLR